MKNKNLLQLFIGYYSFSLIYICIASYLFIDQNMDKGEIFSLKLNLLEALLLYSGASILETFTASFLVILCLHESKFLRHRKLLTSVLAAIPFGLMHWSGLNMIIISYIMGIVFNLFYLKIYEKKGQNRYAILYTSLLHFSINMTTYVMMKVLN